MQSANAHPVKKNHKSRLKVPEKSTKRAKDNLSNSHKSKNEAIKEKHALEGRDTTSNSGSVKNLGKLICFSLAPELQLLVAS